jgi:hypothetical protein
MDHCLTTRKWFLPVVRKTTYLLSDHLLPSNVKILRGKKTKELFILRLKFVASVLAPTYLVHRKLLASWIRPLNAMITE